MDILNSFDTAIGVIGGVVLIVAWAGAVLWGLGQAALSASKGQGQDQNYLVGLVVGCAFGAGVVLAIKKELTSDTVGLGFALVLLTGLAIGLFGRVSHQRRP